MKQFLSIILVIFLGNCLYAQNLNKESDNLNALSKEKRNHIYVDFLDKLDFVQEIGLGESAINYKTYKDTQKLDKDGNIILKKHPYFSSVRYDVSNGVVESIHLNIIPKKVDYINEFLTSLYGASDQMSYGFVGRSIFFVPNKYYINFKFTDSNKSS